MFELRRFVKRDGPPSDEWRADRRDIYLISDDPKSDGFGLKLRDVPRVTNAGALLSCKVELKVRSTVTASGAERWNKVVKKKVQVRLGDNEAVRQVLVREGVDTSFLSSFRCAWIVVDKSVSKGYNFASRSILEHAVIRVTRLFGDSEDPLVCWFDTYNEEADIAPTRSDATQEGVVSGYPAFLRQRVLPPTV